MRKRIISLLLVLSMLVGMVPMFTWNVEAASTDSPYFVADDMTEAEAFAAGLEVYVAWYNHHRAYADIVTDPIEARFYDDESAFNKLYSQIYPEGAGSDKGRSVLDEAERWVEDHYDGVDQFSQIESDIMMSILLSCFLYTGNEDENSAGDVEETLEATQDTSFLGYDIFNFYLMQQLLDGSTKFSGKLSPLEFLAEQGERFDLGSFGADFLFAIVKEIVLTGQEKKDAISKATQYDNIKSVSASDVDILREYEDFGFIGDYVKLYTKAYDESLETGESSLKEALLSQTGNHNDMIIDLSATAITTSASAVAAGTASSVALGAGVIAAGAGGFVLFNILEGVWKLGGDLLFGQDAMKSADLTLFYLGWIRDMFYNGYKGAYRDFGFYPTQENAQKLNAYSRVMYRIFAASEMYASQINNTYATAGALNAEWMHYISGKIDPELTAIAATQSESMLQLRKKYLDNPFDAYSAFCDNSVYKIELNLVGGSYSLPEAFGLSDEKTILAKIKTIDTVIPEGVPVRKGYVFSGWTTDPNATTPNSQYAPGSTYSQNADLTLYAVWEEADTITYNANGGTGAPSVQENTEGNTTLSTKVPTRSGYTFLGWDENKSAKTPTYKYEAGKSMVLTKEGNVTLYAIWAPIYFDVVFNANGGTFPNSQTTITAQKQYGAAFSFSTTPTWGNRKLLGWSWTKDGKEADLAHPIVNVKDLDGKTGTFTRYLYAVWDDGQADILYDYGDDPTGKNTTKIYDKMDISNGAVTYTVQDVRSDKKTYNGNSFKGWMHLEENGKLWWATQWSVVGKYTLYKPGNTLLVDKDEEFYAKWTWLVHYDYGNGQYVHAEVSDAYPHTVIAPSYEIAGKTFQYWSCVDADGNTATVKPGEKLKPTSDLMLFAVWEPTGTTEKAMPGDINGDSVVDNRDLFALQRYLEGGAGSVVKAALDTDGNGTVNKSDFTRLHQYLSDWNVTLHVSGS